MSMPAGLPFQSTSGHEALAAGGSSLAVSSHAAAMNSLSAVSKALPGEPGSAPTLAHGMSTRGWFKMLAVALVS